MGRVMVEYEDWGVNREAGGQPGGGGPWAIAGTGASGGGEDELGRSGWYHPVGGTEASGTLHST